MPAFSFALKEERRRLSCNPSTTDLRRIQRRFVLMECSLNYQLLNGKVTNGTRRKRQQAENLLPFLLEILLNESSVVPSGHSCSPVRSSLFRIVFLRGQPFRQQIVRLAAFYFTLKLRLIGSFYRHLPASGFPASPADRR